MLTKQTSLVGSGVGTLEAEARGSLDSWAAAQSKAGSWRSSSKMAVPEEVWPVTMRRIGVKGIRGIFGLCVML